MLYSYKNQYPSELPERIRLSDGRTRTDKTTFTPEEIIDAGYVEVPDMPIVSEWDNVDWNGEEWIVTSASEEEKFNKALTVARNVRNGTIESVMWRIERYESEVRQGLTPTDDIKKLDEYIQALRDITKQEDPFNIIWPDINTYNTNTK